MRRGGQFTNNLGPGWTRIAPRKEEGFQVSKGDSRERGISKENSKGDGKGRFTRGCALAQYR